MFDSGYKQSPDDWYNWCSGTTCSVDGTFVELPLELGKKVNLQFNAENNFDIEIKLKLKDGKYNTSSKCKNSINLTVLKCVTMTCWPVGRQTTMGFISLYVE